MNASPALSYILTSFNKMSYLKVTLPFLLEACQQDEEIVVVDGGSTDGSAEYLRDLFDKGKIHQFVSEKDFGEAHGTNKAVLMAKGSLIKIITDDDAYSYPDIRRCRNFMENHPEIDVLGTNGSSIDFIATDENHFHFKNATSYFQQWQKDHTPFIITGLGMMLRKSSLPLIGLFDTNFMIIDFEYSLRVTSGKGRLAWYSGCCFVNIVNQNSNSGRYWKRLNAEKARLDTFYGRGEFFMQNQYLKLRAAVGEVLKGKTPTAGKTEISLDYPAIFAKAMGEIRRHDSKGDFYY